MTNISVLDILKIGIGPSSSHTMGPWVAALQFIEALKSRFFFNLIHQVKIHLYGSLALTGKGHATQEALLLGLIGYHPETIPIELVKKIPKDVADTQELHLGRLQKIDFSLKRDILFHYQLALPFHANGLTFQVYDAEGILLTENTFYSIGGGFVIKEHEEKLSKTVVLPFPIETAADLKNHCLTTGKSMTWIIRQNEAIWQPIEGFETRIKQIWETMLTTLYKGCHTAGILPGGLKVNRRANKLLKDIIGDLVFDNKEAWLDYLQSLDLGFEDTLKLVSCFAIATNEENADFGRVVTAPTNGAAGVIPAVLMYYLFRKNTRKINESDIIDFLCVAAEIGSIFKKNATISAAAGGCQAEIGVSSAMAAAALTYSLNGTVDQVLMAAEIAMEHHLGMTCDPVGGLVQVPCIERNSMGAIKAITASQIALSSDPTQAKISLDNVIQSMWETAQDMNHKYKETSLGGLAKHHSVNLAEC